MVFFALVTALVLNRKVIGRGFWRGVYFYPVLLSPVVVALICLVGVLPYIALQLKGIVLGVNLLIGAGADAMGTRAQDTALTPVTAADRPSSRVKRSRDQSQLAPRRRS